MSILSFEEPGSEFELEKIRKTNLATRIRVAVLFAVFILLIVFIIKNDFRFSLQEETKTELLCSDKNKLNLGDYRELQIEKAHTVVQENEKVVDSLDGFLRMFVVEEPLGYQGRSIPVINIEIKKTFFGKSEVPEEMCGFKVHILYGR